MAYRVAVFCSANPGLDPTFIAAARVFGQGLAQRGWELIYGGAQVGLMGTFSDASIEAGGVVRGAITDRLADGREIPHDELKEHEIVEDLFER
ncbi:MAG: TIGR00730 family Rossman fold protein, partial [Bdellovibrionota bacterium]